MKWKVNTKRFDDIMKEYGIPSLVQKTGYSRSILYSWKNGDAMPSIKAVLKICNAFGLNPASFFEIEGVESIKNPPLDGVGEIQELDVGTQYTCEIKGNILSIVPISDSVIELKTYAVDEESIGGYRQKERFKIKI